MKTILCIIAAIAALALIIQVIATARLFWWVVWLDVKDWIKKRKK